MSSAATAAAATGLTSDMSGGREKRPGAPTTAPRSFDLTTIAIRVPAADPFTPNRCNRTWRACARSAAVAADLPARIARSSWRQACDRLAGLKARGKRAARMVRTELVNLMPRDWWFVYQKFAAQSALEHL